MEILDFGSRDGIEAELLSFDEEIVLDYTSMPEDTSEGAQMRDITLSELLYEDEFSVDDTLDLADVLQRQGV